MHLVGNLTQKKNLGIIMSHFTKLNLRDMAELREPEKISDRAMGTHLFQLQHSQISLLLSATHRGTFFNYVDSSNINFT